MSAPIDHRIVLVFGQIADAGPLDALLVEGKPFDSADPGAAATWPARHWFQPGRDPAHIAGCACCTPRSTAAMAVARLLLDRGRGTGPCFTRIVAVTRTGPGRDAIRQALVSDPIAAAYLRAGPDAPPASLPG